MCTALLVYDLHPTILLLLTFNRDEFFDRPTAPAAFWEDKPDILAGRDLKGGGTWLGFSRTGRFACVTNIREVKYDACKDAKSRGYLPVDFLNGHLSPVDYLEKCSKEVYNGYNVVVGDLVTKEVAYSSNRSAGGGLTVLKPGIHGLSNGVMGAPHWTKVDRGKAAIEGLLAAGGLDASTTGQVPWSRIFDSIMSDCKKLPPEAPVPATGVDRETELELSSLMVKPLMGLRGSPPEKGYYGTRSQTTVVVMRDGAAELRERSIVAAERRASGDGNWTWREVQVEFQLSKLANVEE